MITIDEMATSVINTIQSSINIFSWVSYITGACLILTAIFKVMPTILTNDEQERAKSNRYLKLFILLATGTMLVYLPTTISVATATVYDPTDLMSYQVIDKTAIDTRTKDALYIYIKLIGFFAMFRGICLFNTAPHDGEKEPIAKAMTLLLAGALCVNLHMLIDSYLLVLFGDYYAKWVFAMISACALFTLAMMFDAFDAICGRNPNAHKEEQKANDLADAMHHNSNH